MVHCKKCDQVRYFKTISELRTHQWRKHSEIFKGFKKNLENIHKRGWTKEQHKKHRATMAIKKAQKTQLPAVELVHVAPVVNPNGSEMTVSTLLGKLKDQRDFMVNVVSMIENIVKG